MKKNQHIGERIKTIRETREISIEALAATTEMQVKEVEEIENETIYPSLSPLVRIARALEVRLGTFLDDQGELGPVVDRKQEQNEGIGFSNSYKGVSHKQMEYYPLSKSKAERHMEPFIINISPGNGRDYTLTTHEGEEFIYVLEGVVQVSYGKNDYILEEGDSIYYDSIVEHHVHAKNGTPAKILAVVYTPV